jgi:hypothetical protein
MDFGRGICENGNLAAQKRDYVWEDSDQPGIWYALELRLTRTYTLISI